VRQFFVQKIKGPGFD